MVAFKILINTCYLHCFRQYFAGCSRVSFFHLNNWDNEGDSE